jgi:hypothetical protein
MSVPLLAPVFALILWSLVMLIWMATLRIAATSAMQLMPDQIVGQRGLYYDQILPPQTNWPAHNYAHLMEQPTIFYATALAIAMMGQGTALNVALAWSYVALRIAHSLWQAQINTIPVRALLFLLSSLVLLMLAANGMIAALTSA